MEVRQFIQSRKTITKAGVWRHGGTDRKEKMGPNSFAFGSRRPFILGLKWHWRVDQLDCSGHSCRLLTAYEPSDEKYLAWLAVERASDVAIVGCYEFHGDHPGWHFHAKCCAIADLAGGAQRQRNDGKRVPNSRAFHRDVSYEMTQSKALNRAYTAFNVNTRAEGQMV